MSDIDTGDLAPSTETPRTAQQAGPQADAFLQFLVNLVNSGTALQSVGVTLQIDGMLVGGHIISGAEYFDRFAVAFSDALTGEQAGSREAVRTALAGFGDVFRQEQPASPLPNYIHLTNAQFFTTDGKPISQQPVLWRGRLAEVDGFVLGNLQWTDAASGNS
ncbi:gas vesicle accessory protein GvpU [Pseudomonadota bacterium AL_CKDN230030165-1A_HGKHYDSX7]